MNDNPTDALERAASLYAAGDRDGARSLLMKLVRQQPQNAEAWFGLGQSLDDPTRKRECYRQALDLDPFHARAARALERLDRRPSASVGDGSSVDSLRAAYAEQHVATQQVARKGSRKNLILAILGGLLLLVLCIGGGIIAYNQLVLPPVPAVLTLPTATQSIQLLPPTWTPVAPSAVIPTELSTLAPSSTPLPTSTTFIMPTLTPTPTATITPTATPEFTATPEATNTPIVKPERTRPVRTRPAVVRD
jgi:hypothetical protein